MSFGRPGRALWHALFEQDSRRFLITSSYTERQKVERAFAAELLAPAAGVQRQLGVGADEATIEDLDDVGDHFGVSSLLIGHQVENQLLA
jgi:Zn-dependent peptidase ImmA (M78 family)